MQNYRNNPSQYRGYRQVDYCQTDYRQMDSRQTDSCCKKDDMLEGLPLAMAYVPWQMWRDIFDAEKGFQCGTIFEELNKPFRGTGGGK